MSTRKPSKNYPKRGEIYLADLNPGFGIETHKKRPILVISDNAFNKIFSTIITIPFTSIVPIVLGPELVKVEGIRGLDRKSALIIHHIRAVDVARLGKKIGRISKEKIFEVETALKIALGITELN